MSVATTRLSADAATEYVDLGDGRYAYRAFGAAETDPPLVLFQRFRGTMDDWDPALLDPLAQERRLVIFDNEGVSRSTGRPGTTIAAMATQAKAFLDTLGTTQIDLLGWSMGGAVAQRLVLDHPGFVRRLVLAATGPGGVPDAPRPPAKVAEVALKPVNDAEDFLYLFFPEQPDGRAAGFAHLARLGHGAEPAGPAVAPDAISAQIGAILAWSAGEDAALERLGEITIPVLVANGVDDVMTPAYNSYVLSQRIPDAELILYRRAGHGFLFQHAPRFARAVTEFLAAG